MVEIKLARNAGFCWGVKKAIDITLDAAHEKNEKIFTFGPLIHNPQLIKLLENKNIYSASGLKDIEGKDVIIRTHGITPKLRTEIKEAGNKIIDATCPLVAKVQGMIKKHSRSGHSIIIIGDEGHAEIIGLKGFAVTPVFVISNESEVESLPEMEKVFVAAQTTCDREKYIRTIERLKQKYPGIVVGDTICDATDQRQEEVTKLADEVDFMVVVGGKNSANTKRLAEIASSRGINTVHIETEDELDIQSLVGYQRIGVTAGASTPKWLIDRVITKLEKLSETEKYNYPKLVEALRFLIKSNLLLALSGSALTFINLKMMNLAIDFKLLAITFFAVLSTYLFHQLLNASNFMISMPKKYYYHNKYRKLFTITAIATLIAGGTLALFEGIWPFILYIGLTAFGSTYRSQRFRWERFLPLSVMKDIPGIKDIFVAIGWCIATVIIPWLSNGGNGDLLIPLTFTLGVIYIRSVISELRDISVDQVMGKDGLAIAFGIEKASAILYFLIASLSLMLAIVYVFVSPNPTLLSMLAGVIYLLFFVSSGREKAWSDSAKFEFFLDAQLVLVAILAISLEFF